MNIVRVLEVAMLILAVLLFVTQITIPLYRGRPLFPWFRREAKLLAELDEVRQAKEEKKLQQRLEKEKADLNFVPPKTRKAKQ